MIEVKQYTEQYRNEWNRFLSTCKNRHFMFHRDYMGYHADRYLEYSHLFFKKNRLVAILPANLDEKDVISHGLLTFGGVLYDGKMTIALMLEVFDTLIDLFRQKGIKSFIYKAIPHIYHQYPAEEDLYALFRNKANLYRRDVSCAIELTGKPQLTKGKKWSIKKAAKMDDLEIKESEDLAQFWSLLNDLLDKKYGKRPVHNLKEIRSLKISFPNQIKLFGVHHKGELIGGSLMFENGKTVHTQYIASNDHCREIGGLDALFSFLISKQYAERRFFNFGISNDKEGWYLNEGLTSFKEGFGARAIVHDFYRISINS